MVTLVPNFCLLMGKLALHARTELAAVSISATLELIYLATARQVKFNAHDIQCKGCTKSLLPVPLITSMSTSRFALQWIPF